jgi:hypothetical protein
MNRIVKTSNKERKMIFETAASKLKIPAEMIEKDFWVCWTLNKLFSNKHLASILRFKGGTSLSKVFHLIKRFSEDIDLILDWRCVTSDDPFEKRSNSKQDLFNKDIQNSSGDYISTTLCQMISDAMENECSVSVDSKDPHVLLVKYPESFPKSYITPHIKLEIGPLASWVPNDNFDIETYVGEALPELKIPKFNIPVILAERTFWEKVTILHQEHHRPEHLNVPLRYSRHYYDLFMMCRADFFEKVLANLDLLKAVVEFKKKFYPRGWARYDLAVPGSIKLSPAPHSEKALREDYKAMRNMIFGDYPSWDEICQKLNSVEVKINKF